MVCDVQPAALATPPSCMPPGGARLEYTAASGWACVCKPGYSGVSCTVGSGSDSGFSSCAPPPCDAPGGTGVYTLSSGAFTCVCAQGYTGSPCAPPPPPPPSLALCSTYPTSQYSSHGVPASLGALTTLCNCTGWTWTWNGGPAISPSSYFMLSPPRKTQVDANQYPGAIATLISDDSDPDVCPGYSFLQWTVNCSFYNYTSTGGTCSPPRGYTETPWGATCFANLSDCQQGCPSYTSASSGASATFGTCGYGGVGADTYGNYFGQGVCTAASPYYCPMNDFSTLQLPGFNAPVISGFMSYDLAYVAVRSPYECAAICRSYDNCVGFVLIVYDNNLECDPKYNMATPSWNSCPTAAGCFGFVLKSS